MRRIDSEFPIVVYSKNNVERNNLSQMTLFSLNQKIKIKNEKFFESI